MKTIILYRAKSANSADEFVEYAKTRRSNPISARAWAEEMQKDLNLNYGNGWPRYFAINGKVVGTRPDDVELEVEHKFFNEKES